MRFDVLPQLHGLLRQPRTIMAVKHSVHRLLTFPPVLLAGFTSHLAHEIVLCFCAVTESIRLDMSFGMISLLDARPRRSEAERRARSPQSLLKLTLKIG
jgi:hypothetical protein